MTEQDAALQPEDCSTLPDEQLLGLIWSEGDRLSRGVIDEIARRGERLIPRLAELVNSDASWLEIEPPGTWGPVHATFALSATGSMEAVPPLLEAIRRARADDMDWILDVASELFNRIGPGCFEQLRSVFRARDEDLFVRWHCLDAMASLSVQHEDLQPLVIREAAAARRSEAGTELEDAACYTLSDYYALGRTKEVLEALGDPEESQQWLEHPEGRTPFHLAGRDPLAFYDPDAIAARQERWKREDAQAEEEDCLEDDEVTPYDDEDDDEPWRDEDILEDLLQAPPSDGLPFVRAEPKVGRNDPCPCGSGRKYKKCCQDLA